MKAIIPAAGLGTRFLPVTKAVSKEMLPVLNKPVIQYVVEEALGAGSTDIVIVSNRSKVDIEEYFAPNNELVRDLRSKGKTAYADAVEHVASLNVSFEYQDSPRGLGDAILCGLREANEERCFVLLGDTIILSSDVLRRMLEVSERFEGASVLAVIPVEENEVSRFGVIDGCEIEPGIWEIAALVEKPLPEEAPSSLAIFGRYLLTSKIREYLGMMKPGAGGEIQLTDALDSLLEEEKIYALVIDAEIGFDTGTVDSWLDANNRIHNLLVS